MAISFKTNTKASQQIVDAMKTGDEKQMQEAWQAFGDSIAQQVVNDFKEYQETGDKQLLSQRGYRQLTSRETNFYQKLIGALKSPDPKQAFVTILGGENEDDLMPETIIQDVYKDLEDNHPLLSRINFQYTGYATKWILNDHTAKTAVWGKITDAITKEIESSFKVIDLTQNKLSCYAIIEKSMLELGPTFLDGYIRRVLKEAMACGLEYGIVKGTGKNEPIGLIKDIHKGVSVSDSTYTDKVEGYGKYTVKSFTPEEYGKLVAALAKAENGKQRNVTGLTLLCTPTDYYTKVMPATTVLTANGTYVNNLFPVPTDVITTTQLTDGQAILFLPSYYNAFAGGQRNNVIEYSDEYKFLEDQRVFKVKQHATGRAYDNNCALLLDISGLEPAYINVKDVSTPAV